MIECTEYMKRSLMYHNDVTLFTYLEANYDLRDLSRDYYITAGIYFRSLRVCKIHSSRRNLESR